MRARSCQEVLVSLRQKGGGSAAPGKGSTDPDEVRCCEQAAKNLVNYADFVNHSGCCAVEFPSLGPTCTPWGPPVPPAMPRGWV